MNFTFIKYVFVFYETLMTASKVNLLWFGDFNNNFLIFPPVRSRSCRWKAITVFIENVSISIIFLTILILLLRVLWYECLHCLVQSQDVVRRAPHPRPGIIIIIINIIIIIIIIIPGIMDGPTGEVNVHTCVIAHLSEEQSYYLLFGYLWLQQEFKFWQCRSVTKTS